MKDDKGKRQQERDAFWKRTWDADTAYDEYEFEKRKRLPQTQNGRSENGKEREGFFVSPLFLIAFIAALLLMK